MIVHWADCYTQPMHIKRHLEKIAFSAGFSRQMRFFSFPGFIL